MMAGNVTPEEALQQATKFMKERVAKGVRRAPAAASSLTMAKGVCGLYVINVGQNDGFVIVSPDDRTDAILGYSDNGTLDPDNMPENMRAWLQGYADEIKWLNEHNYQSSAKAKRVSPVKPAIAPLMKSHWDQDEPFNNLCPEYALGKKSATGCVATAMAQAMYYNQWPTAAITSAIPEYTPSRIGTKLDALPVITFDWANMLDNYTFSYNSTTEKYDIPNFTSTQATAVANLMRYCGQSLEMNYGSSSSASVDDVANALKTYFGYATTTQYVKRNEYNYADWIDMIYHELTQGRVVIYRGSSAGGGHAFICDGYQGEDYFHINWGWGGSSDDYFRLSVVNPYEQGIGGSSTKDGFWIGQGAVVGIQKNGATGTVLDIAEGNFDLSRTALTVSASPTQYKNVDVTITVHNDGSDSYDGEIGLDIFYGEDYENTVYKHFSIPAGGNATETITFVPEHSGIYAVWPYENYGYYYYLGEKEELTVAAGTPDPEITATDNVDLTMTFNVETAEDRGVTVSYGGSVTSPSYNLYGNEFNVTFTLANSTANNYSGKIYYWLGPNGESAPIHSVSVDVPAGTNKDVVVAINDLDLSKQYIFEASYVKNKSYSLVPLGYYILNPAIFTYTADGTKSIVKPTGTSYAAPDGVLVVDLTGTTITTVSGGAINCLFISDKNSLTGTTNFIKNTSGIYTAANITLTDGNDFYTPVDFTATNIEFTYDAEGKWADGSKGWNTIMLPFDVTKVTANGTEIKWFTSSSDTGKDFWLKKFAGDDTSAPKVYFDYATEMKANTPYIIALPGDHWGAANDLSGKTIKFIGTNAEVKKSGAPTIVTAGNYRFVGDTKKVNTENIYCINAAGNKFELKATGGSAAFRPFFKSDIFDRSVESLSIGGGDGPTAIQNIKVGTDSNVYFDLNGRRVLNPTKGVYIKNGNKVVIK